MSDIEYSRHDIELADQAEDEGAVVKETRIPRSVFIVVYQGGVNEFLKQKLNRICDSFGAAKFALPDEPNIILSKAMEIDTELDETRHVIN